MTPEYIKPPFTAEAVLSLVHRAPAGRFAPAIPPTAQVVRDVLDVIGACEARRIPLTAVLARRNGGVVIRSGALDVVMCNSGAIYVDLVNRQPERVGLDDAIDALSEAP